MRQCLITLGGLALAGVAAFAGGAPVFDLLPDMIVNPHRLEDHELRDDIVPGRIHLTLSNATPNIGDGPLEVVGGAVVGDRQRVKQRIYRSDGSSFTRRAGFFVFHPEHDHTHLEDWAIYRLREVLPGDAVGEIVVEGEKTSFCLLDSAVYDSGLPGFPGSGEYFSCGTGTQGISVGFQDIYDKSLPDQWIDVTDVTDGTYWLESEVDPENHVLEKDEANNVARIKVTLELGNLPEPEPEPVPFGIIALLLAIIQALLGLIFGFGG
jgi:hypothetical protein